MCRAKHKSRANPIAISSFTVILLLLVIHVTICAQEEGIENMSNQGAFFEPKAVNDHFVEITRLSHPSGKENPVREYIAEFADKNGIEVRYYKPDATEPGERIIVLYRPGAGGHKDKSPVVLQAHIDMVCYPGEDIFPLKVFKYKDDRGVEWIKAGNPESVNDQSKGTTLGADDGIGVATILAILEDDRLKDYPMECLFTVQEEVDMGGAGGFDKRLLTGRQCINLDEGDEGTVIYGSAGGCSTRYEGSLSYLDDMPDGYKAIAVSVYGLQGGHSGVEINKGRLNAIKTLTDALTRLNKRLADVDKDSEGIGGFDFLLCSIRRDEVVKHNAIPTRARAVIALPEEDMANFKDDLDKFFRALGTQSKPIEKGFEWSFSQEDDGVLPMDRRSTDILLCILRQIPHGVIKMIPGNPGLVETSTNLSNVEVDVNGAIIESSNRSSSDQSLAALRNMHQSIGDCFGFRVNSEGHRYPAWQPDESSTLLSKAKEVYAEIYKDKSVATVIHAGLECGWIVQKYDGEMECIAIGPNIDGHHTGSERLQTSTVKTFYDAVSELLVSLFEE